MIAPEYMQAAAAQGLEWYNAGFGGEGLKDETIARANRIADGEDLTEDHIREMSAWFARHASSIDGVDLDRDKPTPGWVAWFLWGGDATDRAPKWADDQVEMMDDEEEDRMEDEPMVEEKMDELPVPVNGGERSGVFYRSMQLRMESAPDDGMLRLLASTADAVDMGGWREVLVHTDEAINREAATALLLNHDPNQMIGAIRGAYLDNEGLRVDAELLKDARGMNGAPIADLVRAGALRGVSIGYSYSRKDCSYDRENETVTVNKWRLLEVTLTPIPADASAGVRSMPAAGEMQPDQPGADERDVRMSDAIDNKGDQPTLDPVEIENAKRDAVEAAKREVADAIVFAEEHGISARDAAGKSKDQIKDLIIASHKEDMKRAKAPEAPVVEVKADAADKWINDVSENFARHASDTDLILRKCAQFDGADHFSSKVDLAHWAVQGLRAANKTTGSFSTLLSNTANKQLLDGFNRFAPTWDRFCTVKDAVNFNSHDHVGVATGRLTETAENVAFPELNQTEGTYSSQLGMWGATVSVTEQALVNDELGEIMRSFMQGGYAAARTIERQVYNKLLNATWTNDTTTGAALGTAGNIDKVRAGLKGKLSPAGEKMENDGYVIVVDPINRYNADAATGQLYGVSTGGNAQAGSNAVRAINVVDSTFVGDTALYSSALTTDYYLVNDPMIVDTLVVEFLRGQRAPVITEYDAGAVAAVKYKIQLPFQATVATHTDSAGNARVTGIQKATVA